MSDPFVGQVEIFSFQFAPRGWALCNGQLLPINENQALFSLLGTTYGGNGQTTFGLPDLRSRVANSMGQGPGLPNYDLGQIAGEDGHALIAAETPQHTHFMMADATTTSGIVETPTSNLSLGQSSGKPPTGAGFALNIYNTNQPSGNTLNTGAVGNAGGNQPHDNHMPYLCVNFCIALLGTFPSRN